MAPKKQARNGFMIFTFDWKAKYGKDMSLADATAEAGKIWTGMSAQERGPYNDRAKQEKTQQKHKGERLTCTGVPISLVDKERQDLEQRERQMKRSIETTVSNSVKNCELETHSYFFVMANYFTKTLRGGVYVPAEISVARYSLKDGVRDNYHIFVNPGVNIYGHQYEAQHHSETTHKLPLPPNAKGESNLGLIYNDILNFVRDEETGEYPPIYTHRDSIVIVESVLDFLKADMGANNIDLNIHSIQYLFYIMKEATCEQGAVEKPRSHYITDAYFERDFFEYQTGIACTYHEEIDKSKYCTLSCVKRWGFMFSDYMCRDIAISLIPGRHVPENTNLAAIINPAPSNYGDSASHISLCTETSYATKALSEHKIYYDDQKSFLTARGDTTAASSKSLSHDDYPRLGAAPTRKKSASNVTMQPGKNARLSKVLDTSFEQEAASNKDADDLNPWSSRGRRVPLQPDASHFDMDDLSDSESNSMISYGRGRVRLAESLNSTATGGSGRGHFLRRIDQ